MMQLTISKATRNILDNEPPMIRTRMIPEGIRPCVWVISNDLPHEELRGVIEE